MYQVCALHTERIIFRVRRIPFGIIPCVNLKLYSHLLAFDKGFEIVPEVWIHIINPDLRKREYMSLCQVCSCVC